MQVGIGITLVKGQTSGSQWSSRLLSSGGGWEMGGGISAGRKQKKGGVEMW